MQQFIVGYGNGILRFIGCATLAICCTGSVQPAQTPQSQVAIALAEEATLTQATSSTQRITSREVSLDVVVTDKAGQPVTGLKASDFTLTEEGEPQVIRKVDEHDPMSAADMDKQSAALTLRPNTFTNYTPLHNTNAGIALLLDDLDQADDAQLEMRFQLIKYLKQMQPGPPIAIFQLNYNRHVALLRHKPAPPNYLQLIQGFTSDPKVLLAAAESKVFMPTLAEITNKRLPVDALIRRLTLEKVGGGMRLLDSYLAGFPGRTNLIWFKDQMLTNVMGPGFGHPFRARWSVDDESGDVATDLTDVLTVNRVAVYPVDTKVGNADHQELDLVAEETGGKAYYNTNDFTRVITDVINTGSSYYTITYATTNSNWNGEFRHIKVTVDRPDLHLQHRQGYYAYSPNKTEPRGTAAIEMRREYAAAQPPAGETQDNSRPRASATIHNPFGGGFDAALAFGAVQPTEIVFVAHVQPEMNAEKFGKETPMPSDDFMKPEWQHKPFRIYTVALDADMHKIRFVQTPDGIRHGEVEFVQVVYTGDGQQVNLIAHTTVLNLRPDTYREILASGLHVEEQIAIPVKGNFFLRLGVHDLTGDQVGALEIPVDKVRLTAAGAGRQPQQPSIGQISTVSVN
jgi:VWFA-related protein